MYKVFDVDVVREAIDMSLTPEITEKFENKLKVTLSPFSKEEAEALVTIIESAVYHSSDPVRDLVQVNLVPIIQLARAVKAQCRSEFGGYTSRGNELTATAVDALQFNRIWGNTNVTKFENSLTSVGVENYIGTADEPESTNEEEGFIFLGFIDPVADPIIIRSQIVKDKTESQYAALKFEYSDGYPLAALPEPWVILPEQSYYIQVRNKATGLTKLEPIAFKITRAKNLLSI